jgi:hypothetical protein
MDPQHWHQANATGDKVWYRCVYRVSLKCSATAVFLPARGVIKPLATEHSHSPLILKETIRYGTVRVSFEKVFVKILYWMNPLSKVSFFGTIE